MITALTDTGKRTTLLKILSHQRRMETGQAFISDDYDHRFTGGTALTYPKPMDDQPSHPAGSQCSNAEIFPKVDSADPEPHSILAQGGRLPVLFLDKIGRRQRLHVCADGRPTTQVLRSDVGA